MGTTGRKNLSRFIVLHTVWILRPFVMMVYFFVVVSSPQHVVSYREHVCQSTGIWAQVLRSLSVHLHVSDSQLQYTFVCVYMCSSDLYNTQV